MHAFNRWSYLTGAVIGISITACVGPQLGTRGRQPIDAVIRVRGIDFWRVTSEDEIVRVLGPGLTEPSQFGHRRVYALHGMMSLRCYFESDDLLYRPITKLEIVPSPDVGPNRHVVPSNTITVAPIARFRTPRDFQDYMGRQPDSIAASGQRLEFLPPNPYFTLHPRCEVFFGHGGCEKIVVEFPEG